MRKNMTYGMSRGYIKMPYEGTGWKFPLNEKKKEQGLVFIHQEILRKQVRYYPSFWENVWNQMRFQSLSHWILQGGLLLAAMLLSLYLRSGRMADRTALCVSSVFFVFAGNLCISGVMRLFSWHMAELEQTLYLNLKQMVCIRLLEAGTSDLVILAIFTAVFGGESQTGAGACLLYMLVPFLWSDTLYLCMISHFRRGTSSFRAPAMGFISGAAAFLPLLGDACYDAKYRSIWIFLGILGGLLLAAQIRQILGKIEGGDSLCQNLS